VYKYMKGICPMKKSLAQPATFLTLVFLMSAFSNPIPTDLVSNAAQDDAAEPVELPYEDDFSSESSWGQFDDDTSKAAQEEGVFRIEIFTPEWFASSELGADFEDVSVEVDVHVGAGGLGNGYGLACRISDKGQYEFTVTADGYYRIIFWNEVEGERILADWTRSSAIFTGHNQINRISATCFENQLTLSVNGKHLATVADDRLQRGDIALFAQSIDQQEISVKFDNLIAQEPSDAAIDLLPASDLPKFSAPMSSLPYQDDFSTPSSWWQHNADDASLVRQDGAFLMTIHEIDWFVSSDFGGYFEDIIIEADLKVVAGSIEYPYGVSCRVTPVSEYAFNISSDGFYSIYKWDEENGAEFLVDWRRSAAIITRSGNTNRIKVTCNQDQLSLSVNGQHLATVADDSIPGGDIAIFAETYDQPGFSVLVDNVELSSPSEAGVELADPETLPLIREISMELPYREDFSGPTSWWAYDADDARLMQEDDVYHISVHNSHWFAVGGLGAYFEDVVIETDVKMIGGPQYNAYGVSCRMSLENQYMFHITGEGFYRIYLYSAEEDASVFLVDWTESPVIKTGQDEVNHLTVICQGEDLSLSVNGQLLASVTDATLSGGDVALTATAYDEPGVAIEFDNVEIRHPVD
jgi:hypothetical protein